MTRARLSQRLNALTQRIHPAHSLAAKVARLAPDMRARYIAWATAEQERIATLEAERGPGGAYAAHLDGKADHPMPDDVCRALGLTVPTITADMSSDQAAEVYRSYRERGL